MDSLKTVSNTQSKQPSRSNSKNIITSRDNVSHKNFKCPNRQEENLESAHRPLKSPVKNIFPVKLNHLQKD